MSSEGDAHKPTLELLIEQEANKLDRELAGALAELDNIIGALTDEQSNTFNDAYSAELRATIEDYNAAREELLKAVDIFSASDAGSHRS